MHIYIYIPEKGEGESQRETNMVVQDWEEKIATWSRSRSEHSMKCSMF